MWKCCQVALEHVQTILICSSSCVCMCVGTLHIETISKQIAIIDNFIPMWMLQHVCMCTWCCSLMLRWTAGCISMVQAVTAQSVKKNCYVALLAKLLVIRCVCQTMISILKGAESITQLSTCVLLCQMEDHVTQPCSQGNVSPSVVVNFQWKPHYVCNFVLVYWTDTCILDYTNVAENIWISSYNCWWLTMVQIISTNPHINLLNVKTKVFCKNFYVHDTVRRTWSSDTGSDF